MTQETSNTQDTNTIEHTLQLIRQTRLVAIVRLSDLSQAEALTQALLAGGIGCIEITLRTEAGIDAIRRIAEQVPEGKVYAVEVQEDAVEYLTARSKTLKFGHVEAIQGGEQSPSLPDNTLDLAIMVDVYHELLYPVEMLQAIKRSLKYDGKLLLIEYRGEDLKLGIKKLHKMTVEQIEKELAANGFRLSKNGQFMNIQHFLVFEKE